MKHSAIVIIGIWLFSFLGFGQETIQFQNIAFDQGIYNYYTSAIFGEGVSFFDFNEDGWDDLTICNQNNETYLYKNNEGTFEIWQVLEIQQAKACVWGDIDNDGDNEIIFSAINQGLKLFSANDAGYFTQVPGAFNWTEVFPSVQDFWLYGLSLGDINGDHFLDLIVANYNWESQNFLFLNNGNGSFELFHNNHLKYDLKASFQPAFIDLNKDLQTDLYIVNDFEQGNNFYWNQMSDPSLPPLQEDASNMGLDIAINSMCNSWHDYDNDGDLDVYVSNLEPGNRLMKNNGLNQFVNVADTINVAIHRQCWSSLWIDINNDQKTDLLASSANADWPINYWPGSLLMNNGSGLFSEPDTTIFTNSAYSACKGDINNDGLYDVALNAANEDFFQLYQNTTNTSNHFLKIKFNGVISNRNGVGVHYNLYTQDNYQYGYTQSGENYLGQNSQNIILGIGNNTTIDSLIISWPSGIIDKYFSLESDHFHSLYEGQSGWAMNINNAELCNSQDSVQIVINHLFDALWPDGDTSSLKWISVGEYNVDILYNDQSIDTLHIIVALSDNNNITYFSTPPHCTALDGSLTVVQNSDTLYQSIGLGGGPYIIEYSTLAGCPIIDSIYIEADNSFDPLFTITNPACQLGSIGNLNIEEGQNIQLSIEPLTHPDSLVVGQYNFSFTNNFGCNHDTLISVVPNNNWEWNIDDTISLCEGNYLLQDEWFESNISIELMNNWPMTPIYSDTTLEISFENELGCIGQDNFYIIIPQSPEYYINQTVQSNNVILNLNTSQGSSGYFIENSSTEFNCAINQFVLFILESENCNWLDSIWIEVPFENKIKEDEIQDYWLLNNNILERISANTSEINCIVNGLGQHIPFTKVGNNKWQVAATAYPLFINVDNRWRTVKILSK